ncbi:MAG: ABC-F family ATP-binding cassette domain-containing protein [Flavobacteriaceae bacterium]
MINIHKLTVSFGGEELFGDISFRINQGDRIGLIGKNGAGKTTLLKLLSGSAQADSGAIAFEKGIRTGFLKQDIDFEKGSTVLEETYKAFKELQHLEGRLDEINSSLAERTDYDTESYSQLMIDLNELSHQYEILGGYHYQGETERVLLGLGFKRSDFNKSTDIFSGGWRMRIELAKLLLEKNDVLLLDEPTNHLDIDSIIWLESHLQGFPGALIIVSHDRMFLDQVTNRTVEISFKRIYDYKKPYSQYMILREEIKEQQLNAKKNQDREIQQTERLIERFRAKASKATMAQSLIKKLDRMERIAVDAEEKQVMKVQFPVSVNPGKIVAELKGLSKSYGDKTVLDGVDLMIERNSKTAFVGQNGQGKTTLARILVGELSHEGSYKLGHNVQIGYFAQDQVDHLDGEKTVHDTMVDAARESNRSKVRDILGAFLFRGDDVDKYVKVLSGGERNRLALALMLMEPINVLVMDEPTNHLDMKSKQVLKQALVRFEGTLIVVSHDRDFLQGLTNKVYEFKDQKIKEFLGDIDEYLKARMVDDFRAIEKAKKIAAEDKPANHKKLDYQEQKRLKSIRNRISKLEKEISALEKEISDIDHELLMNYDQTILQPDFFDSYQQKKKDLEKLMNVWEEETEKLEKQGGGAS